MTASRPLGTVLVTGGASGLGAAVAAAVGAAGGRPVVLDVAASDHPYSHVCDVSDTRAVEQLVTEIAADVGGFDAVVTAAGIDRPAPFGDLAGDVWERIVAVNLLGTVAVVRAALPSLLKRHGRVVTIASSLGLRVFPDATAYCASKFGVVGFSRALAIETKGRLGVTTVYPAGMDTRFFDGREDRYKPGADAKLIDARDAAETILFALTRPQGVELREVIVCPEEEPSWP
ncbi:SDR family oxidoreductase [Microbacterium sp. AZCO]|uniref:SDR family oxidoreductase n=1 Tax=Microbacterium sp. AZCO TaxID=3142976 RepID=UPI0031F3621B